MKRYCIAVFVVIAWLAGCVGQSSTPSVPVLPNGEQNAASPSRERGDSAQELPEPPVVNSHNGIAKVALFAQISGQTGFPEFIYKNMGEAAPTIRVNPGDTIVMDVTDEFFRGHGGPKHLINIHFHGLGSSPHAPGDDVLGTVGRPGETLHYVVHVPKNQEPGLYWYHPHIHGETTYQVGQGGMSGAIVVNGLEQHIPSLAKMRQRVIVVRATGLAPDAERDGDDGDDDMNAMSGMSSSTPRPQGFNTEPCGSDLGLTTKINWAYHPTITIAPGEKQFFRVINATGHKTLRLWYGGEMQVVAIDGFAYDTWPGNPPYETVKTIVIPPAARAEFVVTGPRSGYADFRTLCYDSGPVGDHDPDLVLGRMIAPNRGHGGHYYTGPLTVGAPLPQNAYTTPLPPVAAKRVVVFSEGNKRFLLNGKSFKIADPPMFVVHVGTVEEWRLVNVTDEIHDFHLHQAHFLVKQINGVRLAHPYWADSVVVPHRRKDGQPGTEVVVADFRDPIIKGTFLFHCHILDHEDKGMMAKIEAI